MSTRPANRRREYVLQSSLGLSDNVWDFRVSSLPDSPVPNNTKIKHIFIHTDRKAGVHSMGLRMESVEWSRAVEIDRLDQFLLLTLSGFQKLGRPKRGENIPEAKQPPRTIDEITEYIVRLLKSGVRFQGVHYNFYGHSNSQLKSRSCMLFAASKQQIDAKIEAMGDFSTMKTIAKKVKRIGLMFSTAKTVIRIHPDYCEDIPDIESTDYIFTDGCGLISPTLARDLARRHRIIFRTRYTPSVFQIRYRGYKGVVTVDPRMVQPRPCLKLRKSMKKFSGGDNWSFGVVGYSKPYCFGHLNDEMVVLLNALGIPHDVLVKKQDEHFKLLENATLDYSDAYRFLSYINQLDFAERVLMEGIEKLRSQIKSLVNNEYSKMLNKKDDQRCRIFVLRSRLLFGVCDAWDVLEEGECAVRVTLEDNGQRSTLTDTEVMVTRNPCLHPGDIQKFRAVNRPELSHLVDCIVFSTRGKRPAADLMSGGDLDGDQFFVCWDPDLVPSTVSEPAMYPGGAEAVPVRPITSDDRLMYFAKFTNPSLGRIKNLYLDWACASTALAPECQELNRLFSQAVDGSEVVIREELTLTPKPLPNSPPFILDVLHEKAKEFVRMKFLQQPRDTSGFDEEAIEALLATDKMAIREFEFILFVQNWCRKNGQLLDQFLPFFDFNVLKPEEKAWVLAHLPVSKNTPATVLNDMCSSNIIAREELAHFQLDYPGMRWKCTYDSTVDRLSTFLDAAATNMNMFHRKMIVFRRDNRLSLAIYVPEITGSSRECIVDDKCRLFAFPHTQGRERQSRLALPTKMKYRLYCDNNSFQLFEGRRGNSWIYIQRPGSKSERNPRAKGERSRKENYQQNASREIESEIITSIALGKFSKNLADHIGGVRKQPISAAEIYVISNRDVESLKILDLWLECIDTAEKLPLFPTTPKEYRVSKVEDIVRPSDPHWLREVVMHGNMELLNSLELVDHYITVFNTLRKANRRDLLLRCFESTLENLFTVNVDVGSLLRGMMEFIDAEPILIITIGNSLDIKDLSSEHQELFWLFSEAMLQAFIRSVPTVEELVFEPLSSMLDKMPAETLSMLQFARLIETLSLTTRCTELAFRILHECLLPHAEHLLVGQARQKQHFARILGEIAMEYIQQPTKAIQEKDELFELSLVEENSDGCALIEIMFRLDSPGEVPSLWTHVRLVVASRPTNLVLKRDCAVEALLVSLESGRARFKCFQPLPPYFRDCSWRLQSRGSFTETKIMMEAVTDFNTKPPRDGDIAPYLLGLTPANKPHARNSKGEWKATGKNLDKNQIEAIQSALENNVMCLWTPPGTLKTETLVEMICALQEVRPGARLLITAMTHAVLDDTMRKYLSRTQEQPVEREKAPYPLRISSELCHVALDLRLHTPQGIASEQATPPQRPMNKDIIKKSDIIFATSMDSGLDILSNERFDVVILDEASQQSEPQSIIPLVKGCTKAILIAETLSAQPEAHAEFSLLAPKVSLFERLVTESKGLIGSNAPAVKTEMLTVQYQMHEDLGKFVSGEFYNGKLGTGIRREARPLPASAFPYPRVKRFGSGKRAIIEQSRAVFINCPFPEAPGHGSKENEGQAEVCAKICKLLVMAPIDNTDASLATNSNQASQSIAVLTPYNRQTELLKKYLSGISQDIVISSIEDFRNRVADIVVFATVRSNAQHEIGSLGDRALMNIVFTRAKAGLIVVGNKETLLDEEQMNQSDRTLWRNALDWLTEASI